MFFGEKSNLPVGSFYKGDPEDLSAMYDASLTLGREISNQGAIYRQIEEEIDRQNDAIKAAGGPEMENPIRRAPTEAERLETIELMKTTSPGMGVPHPHLISEHFRERWVKEYETNLQDLRSKRPDLAHVVREGGVMAAVGQRRREATERMAEVSERAGYKHQDTPIIGPVMDFAAHPLYGAWQLAGGMRAMFESPIDAMANLGGLAQPTTKSLINLAMRAAASNALVQAGLEPGIAVGQRLTGQPYTLTDALNSIGGAAAMGGVLDLGLRGVNRTAIRNFGRDTPAGTFLSRNTERGSFATSVPEDPGLPPGIVVEPPPTPPELQGALDKVRKGDISGVRELADRFGVTEDPAIKGAFDRLEIEGTSPGPIETLRAAMKRAGVDVDIDAGEAQRTIAQALRAAVDPDEPPPGRLPVETKAIVDLADDRDLPAGTTGTNQHVRQLDIDGLPATVREIDLKSAKIAAEAGRLGKRLQSLEGRVWDGERAGRVLALERPDGTLDLIDGRARATLAAGAPGEARAEAVVFREADGWTADKVSRLAMVKNISEGRVSPLVAAEFYRQHPDMMGAVAAETDAALMALSLAHLSDDAWSMVRSGEADPAMAAMVADVVGNEGYHASVLRDLDRAGITDIDQARRTLPDLLPATGVHYANDVMLGVAPSDHMDRPLRGGADIDDPVGSQAKAQVDRLSQELAPEVAEAQAKAKMVADAEEKVADLRREMQGLEGDGAKRAELAQAEADLANLRRGIDGEKIYRLTMDAIAQRRMQDIRLAVSQALGFADRVTPEGTKVAVVDDLRSPDGRAVDATSDMATGDIQLAIAAVDPMAKIGHEAVHTLVTRGHLSPDEVGQLAALAREAKTFADEAKYRDVYADRANLDRLIDEEAAASYIEARIKGTVEGPVNTIVERIRQLLERIRQALKGFGFKSREDVVQAILNGEAARRRPVQEWMRANDVTAMATAPGEMDARVVAQGKTAMQRQMAQGVELPDGTRINGVKLYAIRAFHGSPHDFDRFSLDKIGTGEGAQAYGHGLYFAEREGVAKSYRDKLEKKTFDVIVRSGDADTQINFGGLGKTPPVVVDAARAWFKNGGDIDKAIASFVGDKDQFNIRIGQQLAKWKQEGAQLIGEADVPGRLYEVSIKAEPEDFLDWDKPYSAQSEKIKDALSDAGLMHDEHDVFRAAAEAGGLDENTSPSQPIGPILLGGLMGARGDHNAKISGLLKEYGITGIKYLDQGSRGKGDGSRNYVVFDDTLIEIVAKDGQPVQSQKMFAFAGENARTADKEALAKAQEMESAGTDRERIWKDTGWFRGGVDGKWRFEIDDSNAKWNWIKGVEAAETGDGLFGNLMSHRALFEAYPFMQFMKAAGDMDDPYGSYFDTTNQKINVASIRPSDSTMAALHEGQHVIQQFERMPMGGDGFGEYQRLSGEVEARAVEARAKLTPEQRRARPPWLDYDVPESRQIVGNDKLYSLRSDLDMSPEGRKQRAQEMGFDTSRVWYHGTAGTFDSFDVGRAGSNVDMGWLGKGVYFGSDPEQAGYYARVADTRGASNIIPAYLRLQKPFMYGTKNKGIRGEVYGEPSLPAEIRQDVLDRAGFKFNPDAEPDFSYEPKLAQAMRDVLMERGYDGVIADFSRGGQEVVVFDPSNIRSVNADFDPSRSDSPNLMYAMREEEPSPKDMVKSTVRAYVEAYRDLKTTSDALGVSPDDLAELVQRSPETAPIAQRLEMARAQLAETIGDEQATMLTRALIAAAPLMPDVEPRAIADMIDNVLDQMFPDPPPPKPDPMTEIATPLQREMIDMQDLESAKGLVAACRPF